MDGKAKPPLNLTPPLPPCNISQESMERNLTELEEALGYYFQNQGLLREALTHRSWGFPDYERLEFLGDSVLELSISHLLFEALPTCKEGELSKIRASLVREEMLLEIAKALSLGDYLLMGKGEEQTGGRQKPSILASAFEALIGAVYLDGGFEKALEVVKKCFAPYIEETKEKWKDTDFKTQLQEHVQARFKDLPQYILLNQTGPEHQKTFEVAVIVKGQIWGIGTGRSKKEAEQRAAEEALKRLHEL